MNDAKYELGHLAGRFDALEDQIEKGFKRIEEAVAKHVEADDTTFAKHAERLTNLEHANVRVGVYSGLVAMFFTAACAAVARAYFGG